MHEFLSPCVKVQGIMVQIMGYQREGARRQEMESRIGAESRSTQNVWQLDPKGRENHKRQYDRQIIHILQDNI